MGAATIAAGSLAVNAATTTAIANNNKCCDCSCPWDTFIMTLVILIFLQIVILVLYKLKNS